MSFRTGIGYDLHKLSNGRKLFLGGVHIPFDKGLLGHSDRDVLLHAICDALLGACGRGDIGMHFPDTGPEFKDASSIDLLRKTKDIICQGSKLSIVNIDTVVICDKPMIAPYSGLMKKAIAQALDISKESINIKAKTTEGTDVDVVSGYASVLVEIT